MRYFSFFFIFVMIGSCNIQKNVNGEDHSIIYIIPLPVETLMANKIDKTDKNIVFYLEKTADGYSIYFIHYRNNSGYIKWIKNTNRKLFIAGSFYPIILETDEMFATTQNSKEVLSQYSTTNYPTIYKVDMTYDGYYIKFTDKGKILESH